MQLILNLYEVAKINKELTNLPADKLVRVKRQLWHCFLIRLVDGKSIFRQAAKNNRLLTGGFWVGSLINFFYR